MNTSIQAHGNKRRTPPFSMRLSGAEREALEAKADSMPLSSYVKSVVLSDDAPTYRQRRSAPETDQQLLAEILAKLGSSRSANNLNQIAKHLNQGTLIVDEDLAKDLQQAVVDGAWMRATLMAALGVKP